mgnify:CR=1 FL=1
MHWKHDMWLVIVKLSSLLTMNYKISTIELTLIISIVHIASKTFNENFYDQDGIKQPIVGRRFSTKRAK